MGKTKIEAVKIKPVERWGFKCPTCGEFNEIEYDPCYMTSGLILFCEGCRDYFRPDCSEK